MQLADELCPTVPPGDDRASASDILNHVLMEHGQFDDRLRQFLNHHYDAAPTIAAYAWELSGAMATGLLEWVRQWPTETDDVDADSTQSCAAAALPGAAASVITPVPSGPELAVPEGDDPSTVHEITAYVFQSIRELRTKITLFANARAIGAPTSADHVHDLTAGHQRLLAEWAISWPRP
ncbi:hypothetical protein [Nocardia mangyaensis]|uniref:hypothetical protein n=1 Tax=Nocardia mangyaensis TaxID=2213200 RepID=UPI0026766428|nr:hypothetical protein [Nocardia mangyaensis]MDO3645668.1 hypothetical protein [Nocardia mangyaensis]